MTVNLDFPGPIVVNITGRGRSLRVDAITGMTSSQAQTIADEAAASAASSQTSADAAANSADRAEVAEAAVFMTQDEGVATLISDDVAGPLTRAALTVKLGSIAVADFSGEANPVQAAVDAAVTGQTVLLPGGNTVITSPVSITKPIRIAGGSTYGSRILAQGCDGIVVAEGVDDVKLEGFEVVAGTRYSTTPHEFRGVRVLGAAGNQPRAHVYRDIFIDGFHTAIESEYLWASRFDGVRTVYGLRGIAAYGISVNNFVTSCQLNVEKVAGSRGIALIGQESSTDPTTLGSEGWVIAHSLTFGAQVGIHTRGVPHVTILGNIIDFNQSRGVLIEDNGPNYGGNSLVSGNYVAMEGAALTGIESGNSNSAPGSKLNRITDNHLVVYSGSTCQDGVLVTAAAGKSIIRGNVAQGFSRNDIRLQGSGNIVQGNAAMSGLAQGIYSNAGQTNLIDGNEGNVWLAGAGAGQPNVFSRIGGRKVMRWVGIPTTGTFAVGDRIDNFAPAVGQPLGWVCTSAGSPGTWTSLGNL